jgi:hypothetical protein
MTHPLIREFRAGLMTENRPVCVAPWVFLWYSPSRRWEDGQDEAEEPLRGPICRWMASRR